MARQEPRQLCCTAARSVYAVVIGGANVDIGGISKAPLLPADSNPGKITMSLGGVGHNIARNMALLGLDVRMITALGGDLYAQKLTASCEASGVDISQSVQVPETSTSIYLYISAPNGEMTLALSDMEIYSHLTPTYLASRLSMLNGAKLLMVDTNLPAESIAWLAAHVEAPIFADPVSTAKAEKLRPVLGKLHTLKPNRSEAEYLSGVTITDEKSLACAARVLLDTGLQRVFISLGGDGLYAADHNSAVCLPPFPAHVANVTGGGDACMAALAWAYLKGLDLKKSALAGTAAGAVAVEAVETISPALSEEALRDRIGTFQG